MSNWGTYVRPWKLADKLFMPDVTGMHLPALNTISKWRSRVGLAVMLYLTIPHAGFGSAVLGMEFNLFETITIAALSTLAWVGIVRISLAPPVSPAMRGKCRRVVTRVLVLIAVLLGSILIFHVPVLGGVYGIWAYFFILRAFWLTGKYLFGAGDAHPLLAPLVLASTVSLVAALNLAQPSGKMPPSVNELIVLSGLTTTLLLALTEFLLLWRDGYRLTVDPVKVMPRPSPARSPGSVARRRLCLRVLKAVPTAILAVILVIVVVAVVRANR